MHWEVLVLLHMHWEVLVLLINRPKYLLKVSFELRVIFSFVWIVVYQSHL